MLFAKIIDETELCRSTANAGKANEIEREGGGIGPELMLEEEGGRGDLFDIMFDNDNTESQCKSNNPFLLVHSSFRYSR